MTRPSERVSYPEFVAALKQKLGEDTGLRSAVGGDFIATGTVEQQLLASLGLRDGQSVIDVGCGSGRLACQLTKYPTLHYLGTDVVTDLVRYARELCARPEWRFEVVPEIAIPSADATADFVCFFSVFTHLTHEQSYRYLREAARVLKPGGRIVFSFLEFRLAAHWDVFAASVGATDQHLNQFIEREAIVAWARHLGLVVESIADGDRPHIPLETEVKWPDGRVMSGLANLGQSVAVLRVPDHRLTKPLETDFRPVVPVQRSEPAAAVERAATFRSTSVRGHVGEGHAALIAGFTLTRPGTVLVTASGQKLARHGIRDFLPKPQLRVHDAAGELVAENCGWTTLTPRQQEDVAAAVRLVHAEPLDPLGADSALLLALEPGAYTAVVRSPGHESGVVHAEVISLPACPPEAGLTPD